MVKGVGHLGHDEAMEAGCQGTIVGWVFSPTRQLAQCSHLNVPFCPNYKFI